MLQQVTIFDGVFAKVTEVGAAQELAGAIIVEMNLEQGQHHRQLTPQQPSLPLGNNYNNRRRYTRGLAGVFSANRNIHVLNAIGLYASSSCIATNIIMIHLAFFILKQVIF